MALEISDSVNGSTFSAVITVKDDRNCLKIISDEYYCGASLPSRSSQTIRFVQKLMAEFMGTYLLLFTGFAAGVVNKEMNNVLTFPGVAILWGLDVMVMVYTVGHISGAHFNPAVTIAFATCKRFSWKHAAAYILVQLVAAMVASATILMIFGGRPMDRFVGTRPVGSSFKSLALEFIITFYLMFAVSGTATDHRAIGELSGVALGATVTINSLLAGPISGASMNPARSLGPAIVFHYYRGIWIYIVGPIFGALAGAWFYNAIRFSNKPTNDISMTKLNSFLAKSTEDEPKVTGLGPITEYNI